jgi:hypothetical protein
VVKDIHVVELQALERLFEGGEQVFARTPFAVGTGPHVVAGLGRDYEFIAVGGEIGAENLAEICFRRTGRRAVIVGQIEVGDAEIKGAPHNGLTIFVSIDVAEVMPKAERDKRELDA